MSQPWRQSTEGFRMKFKQQGALGNFITLFAILAGAALLLVVGVWLFFILLTIGVLLLPWLWWKRRQLIQRMQQAAHFQHRQAEGAEPTAGRVFEGEVINTQVLDHKKKSE